MFEALQAQYEGLLEAGALAGAAAAACACVGPIGLRRWSCGEAAAIQVKAVRSVGQATQPGKLVVDLLHLTLYLQWYQQQLDLPLFLKQLAAGAQATY